MDQKDPVLQCTYGQEEETYLQNLVCYDDIRLTGNFTSVHCIQIRFHFMKWWVQPWVFCEHTVLDTSTERALSEFLDDECNLEFLWANSFRCALLLWVVTWQGIRQTVHCCPSSSVRFFSSYFRYTEIRCDSIAFAVVTFDCKIVDDDVVCIVMNYGFACCSSAHCWLI